MLDSAVRHSVGQPNTQSPRKLRDSCTDCASSKVKCSKEKPTCARCTRRGVTCTYMVSRRTGRTSSAAALSKAGPAQMWIGASGLAGSASTGSVRPSARTMSLPGSSGPAFGTARLLGGSSTNNTNASSSNNGSNGSRNTNTLRPSLRVDTPLISHTAITATLAGDIGQPTPEASAGTGIGTGTSPDTDLWSSIFSPSTLMIDSAGLSPPLTTIGTDVGDLFGMDHLHSPMVIDCPEELSSTATAIADPDHPLATPELFGDMDLSVSDPDFTSAAHTHASTFDWTLPNGSSGSSGNSTPACCFAIALDLLNRLFPNAALGCALPGDTAGSPDIASSPAAAQTQARTIDSVVSENKQILESLTTLLDCPCSQDEYLISIMTLIALKVMGWYSAAAADDPLLTLLTRTPPSASRSTSPAARRPSSSSASSSVLTVSPGSAAPLAEQVLRAPATVGNYCVAGQHQTRMAAQLVLSELHRVQRLVNALARRLEGVRVRTAALGGRSASSVSLASAGMGMGSVSGNASVSGAGSDSGGEMVGKGRAAPVSEQTFCLLEEDLRKRLRVLSRETIDVLRRA